LEKSLKVRGAMSVDFNEVRMLLALYTKCIKYYLTLEQTSDTKAIVEELVRKSQAAFKQYSEVKKNEDAEAMVGSESEELASSFTTPKARKEDSPTDPKALQVLEENVEES
jgi:hypothetical protein